MNVDWLLTSFAGLVTSLICLNVSVLGLLIGIMEIKIPILQDFLVCVMIKEKKYTVYI
jgi:hypothetical protein